MPRKKEILIGTSGWYYRDWYGPFYEPEHKSYKALRYFSTVFNTVESNAAFYRIPSQKAIETWTKNVEDNFVFSLKLNQTFTHFHRLKLDAKTRELLGSFLATTQTLEERLGAILVQCPPGLKFDLKLLRAFLKSLMSRVNKLKYRPDIAIEFRNKYWFNEEVYEILREHNVALAIAQSSRYPYETVVTADFLYLRFHGPRKLFASLYTDDELREWASYIKRTRGIRRVYIYFNNDYYAYAIQNAKTMQKLLNK